MEGRRGGRAARHDRRLGEQRARNGPGPPSAERGLDDVDIAAPRSEDEEELASKYIDAFERYDIAALTALLHEDATLSMPPYDLWLRGARRHRRLADRPRAPRAAVPSCVPVEANGSPAWGQYRRSESGAGYDPWSVTVLETRDGKVTGINSFLDTDRLFPLFGLPAHLD